VFYLLASFLYAFNAAYRLDVDGDLIVGGVHVHIDPTLNYVALDYIESFIESYFALYIISNFFLECVDEQNEVIRDISQISVRYLKSKFAFHLLTVLPYSSIFQFKYSHLLYLIKSLRIIDTKELLDTRNFMGVIKQSYNA
jgi:hypothetical protein